MSRYCSTGDNYYSDDRGGGGWNKTQYSQQQQQQQQYAARNNDYRRGVKYPTKSLNKGETLGGYPLKCQNSKGKEYPTKTQHTNRKSWYLNDESDDERAENSKNCDPYPKGGRETRYTGKGSGEQQQQQQQGVVRQRDWYNEETAGERIEQGLDTQKQTESYYNHMRWQSPLKTQQQLQLTEPQHTSRQQPLPHRHPQQRKEMIVPQPPWETYNNSSGHHPHIKAGRDELYGPNGTDSNNNCFDESHYNYRVRNYNNESGGDSNKHNSDSWKPPSKKAHFEQPNRHFEQHPTHRTKEEEEGTEFDQLLNTEVQRQKRKAGIEEMLMKAADESVNHFRKQMENGNSLLQPSGLHKPNINSISGNSVSSIIVQPTTTTITASTTYSRLAAPRIVPAPPLAGIPPHGVITRPLIGSPIIVRHPLLQNVVIPQAAPIMIQQPPRSCIPPRCVVPLVPNNQSLPAQISNMIAGGGGGGGTLRLPLSSMTSANPSASCSATATSCLNKVTSPLIMTAPSTPRLLTPQKRQPHLLSPPQQQQQQRHRAPPVAQQSYTGVPSLGGRFPGPRGPPRIVNLGGVVGGNMPGMPMVIPPNAQRFIMVNNALVPVGNQVAKAVPVANQVTKVAPIANQVTNTAPIGNQVANTAPIGNQVAKAVQKIAKEVRKEKHEASLLIPSKKERADPRMVLAHSAKGDPYMKLTDFSKVGGWKRTM